MRLDEMEIRSLAALSSNVHFRRIVTKLEAEQEKTDKALRVASEDTFKQLQGRANLLQEILQDVASSVDVAQKMHSNKPK